MVWWIHSTFFFHVFCSKLFFCVTKCRTLTRSWRERCTRVAFKNKISFTRSLLLGYVWPMPWLTSFFSVPSWVEHKREDGKSLLTPVRNAIFDSSFGLAQWEEEKNWAKPWSAEFWLIIFTERPESYQSWMAESEQHKHSIVTSFSSESSTEHAFHVFILNCLFWL